MISQQTKIRILEATMRTVVKQFGSILLSRVIMRERLRWLGHVLEMKDDILTKIIFLSQPSKAQQKASCLQWGGKMP